MPPKISKDNTSEGQSLRVTTGKALVNLEVKNVDCIVFNKDLDLAVLAGID